MKSLDDLLNAIETQLPYERKDLRKLKIRHAEANKAPLVRNEKLLDYYREAVHRGNRPQNTAIERILQLNAIRSQSGIATVTVITKPYACPGRCVYCPTETRAPKSYLTNEPAVMRAVRNDYDAYDQMTTRLEALNHTGHATDKIELIIKGGTWSFYPETYQQQFIRDCVRAANDFNAAIKPSSVITLSEPHAGQLQSLEAVLSANETSRSRIIGITIETRPDYIDAQEIERMRRFGITRVELGVQSLDEHVLEHTIRDHGLEAVHTATQMLKDAGFKIAYHLMPNLPLATPESDLDSMRTLFDDERYRPDTMKLYPCVVIKTAELYRWWKNGKHIPYDDETLIELLIRMKQLAPPYLRLERVIRDIPANSIQGGSKITNLRETVLQRMTERGLSCKCIRCRQVRGNPAGDFALREQSYKASEGIEYFLSFEDAANDQLASLLRLRIPAQTPQAFPALRGAALVRELHSYGRHLALRERNSEAVQHKGFGRRLLARAEAIASAHNCPRIAIIAGVGVREYYRNLGYRLEDTYMVKETKPVPVVTPERVLEFESAPEK